jgi:hypothetical protein
MIMTVGSDVEVFARNKEGKAIALCGLIGGSKEKPRQLQGLPEGYMVQEDNVSLEYNIPIATNREQFSTSISIMGNEVTKILGALGLEASKDASISFEDDQLTHPQALVFGCEPDYNAWTKTENRKPQSTNKNLRTAGGHVHVGVSDVDMILGIRAMDLYLGVPAVILDNSPAAVQRRELYGKAGAMRPKPYGFEYRVLSNFWMFDKSLTNWVYDNVWLAMNWARKGNGNDLTLGESVGIQECINTGNVELAKQIVAKYNIPMPVSLEEEARRKEAQKEGAIARSRKERELLKMYTNHNIQWAMPETFLVAPPVQAQQLPQVPQFAPGELTIDIETDHE